MTYSKKKTKLSRKKASALSPRDYSFMGSHHDFVTVNPSAENHGARLHSISHKLEKWILVVLLALAVAAFLGFKLLENSDMSFSINDPQQTQASNSLASETEFKQQFDHNRQEARALVEHRKAKPMLAHTSGKKTKVAHSHHKSTHRVAAKHHHTKKHPTVTANR